MHSAESLTLIRQPVRSEQVLDDSQENRPLWLPMPVPDDDEDPEGTYDGGDTLFCPQYGNG